MVVGISTYAKNGWNRILEGEVGQGEVDVYDSYGNLQFGRNDHAKQETAKSERF